MTTEGKVWIAKRKTRKGVTYHLRWVCPQERCWKSRKVDGDFKRATYEAAKLQEKLEEGTYRAVRRMSWADFTDDHVKKLPGASNASEARKTLDEFGEVCNPGEPRRVTYGMVEDFVAHLKKTGRSLATVNKKLRSLKAAFRKGIRRGYLVASPMDGWSWERENRPEVRVVSRSEEAALLKAAKAVAGSQLVAFIKTALNTGGRRNEVINLSWADIDLDGGNPSVLFTHTKAKKDRRLDLNADVVHVLRRLKAKTLLDGGPFVSIRHNINKRWAAVRTAAKIADVTIHDMRRTFCTRLRDNGVSVDVLQELAGHTSFATTMRFYVGTDPERMRQAVMSLSRRQARA